VQHACGYGCFERGGAFVTEQRPSVCGERAEDRHAWALTAGQLRGPCVLADRGEPELVGNDWGPYSVRAENRGMPR